ncbi:NmrA-like family protein [Polyplosphaeria fusca]|uniref:NmrA-like family protein n=1 Tax=Polyplosphaeria fusca TaxID=682080 RepID=A0A9P4QSE0_9PLEO|nr:NmrA-like family protein [Polyplosphaeria fusca]
MSRTIIVTGATGRQGGSVVRALKGSDFEILALTRNTDSPAALKLTENSSNVKLLQGDLDHADTIFTEAKKLASNPIWGVFSVQANTPGTEGKVEEKQGKDFIDAAIAANVEFFVYSSIDRNGDNATPVPHWASKHRIEQYLAQQAAGSKMQYTVLRPTAFMEGLSNDFKGKALATMWRSIMKDRPLQMIATKDIGHFAALAFNNPHDFVGKYTSIAGSTMTYDEANEIFKKKTGKEMPVYPGVVGHVLTHAAKEFTVMLKWLKAEGTSANVEECKRMHPGLTDFGTWLENESDFRKD